ncbi:putative HNHc nuclease [Carnobacterium pleistocenium]|uniref:putative HNHc nuclease n=1 Tax=Carnobacterium pleistocenium TaxID=181073 RepID=UPI00068C1CEB|nr:putative HNHc nuclease [Carnobacterium pleistocenium]
MEFVGKLESYSGNKMIIDIPDGFDMNEIVRKSEQGELVVDFYEKDTITNLQRKHYWALVGDIEEYTGYTKDVIDSFLRVEFMKLISLEEYPSLKRNQMKKTVASELLEYVIDLCITNGIPFRKQQFYLTINTSKMLYALTLKRLCWVCGKPNSEIMHVETVGSGRDRKKIDHSKHHFMCGCWKHHQEQHAIGIDTYMTKYHFKPITLNYEDLIKLGLMSKKKVEELEAIEIG